MYAYWTSEDHKGKPTNNSRVSKLQNFFKKQIYRKGGWGEAKGVWAKLILIKFLGK